MLQPVLVQNNYIYLSQVSETRASAKKQTEFPIPKPGFVLRISGPILLPISDPDY